MRKRTVLYILGGIIIAAAAAFLLMLDIPSWQKLDLNRITQLPQATMVYDEDGGSMGSLYASQNRRHVAVDSLPDHVPQAFIAAEDQRFYSHHGADIRRIFGALWQDIKTLSFAQGASTITQQLIKLTHLTSEKTISRKTQEIALALQLENKISKEEILEAYLNTVYFGSGAYGVEAASEAFFSKKAAELTLSESALLAGIIKSPSGFAPHIHPDNALKRRNYVLQEMQSQGFISDSALMSAKAEPLRLNMNKRTQTGQGWYMDQVLSEAEDVLNMETEEILTSGLRIYTAYDPQIQSAADALFENGANFPDPAADGTPAQAAMIVMNTDDGEIAAVTGGRTYDVSRGLNRATQARRQPGSAIKPVSTYAAAVDACGYLPSSMIEDVQREFTGGYMPGNAGGKTYGTVTLREALSRSLNIATVDLADLIGIQKIRRYMAQFGITLGAQDVNLALALGSMTHGVSPAELCAAYCALANGGSQVRAHAIRSIENDRGEKLYQAEIPTTRAVSAETAYLVTDMLKSAAAEGSAKALAGAGVPVAGKTGTVSETNGGTRDIWTAAYTPELAVAVWMGFDEPDAEHSLPGSAGGSGYPARLCAALLNRIRAELSGSDFAVPEGLVAADIDTAALSNDKEILLASPATPEAYRQREWFHEGQLPQETSDEWDAPEAVDDLILLSADRPSIAFTSKSAAADYLILRKTGDDTQIAAVLSAEPGSVIVWAEDESQEAACSYSVLPRHRLLYENGTLITGPESDSVKWSPGLLSRIFD